MHGGAGPLEGLVLRRRAKAVIARVKDVDERRGGCRRRGALGCEASGELDARRLRARRLVRLVRLVVTTARAPAPAASREEGRRQRKPCCRGLRTGRLG